jgi:predicted Zn finger-like uncharacterized protein
VLSCLKYQEFQVAEAIHCPSCSTRYRLRPERLKPSFRRARCFSCGGVFPVGDVVQRLLFPAPPDGLSGYHTEDLDAPLPAAHGLEAASLAPMQGLTLGDLDGVDAEILEKTLIETPAYLPEAKVTAATSPEPAIPEPAAPTLQQAPPFPPEITESTLSGYTSARDAIEKLFGSAPSAQSGLKVNQEPEAMDMEATLYALESTLGGVSPAPAPGTVTQGDSPTHGGGSREALSDEDLAGPSTSTMRLSQEDLLAAIASVPAPAPKTPEPTVPLRASDLMTVHEEQAAVAAPRSFAPSTDNPDSGSELLRLKVGEEIYGNLTMPQLIAWVGEGRILETHLVARQHSENWLEAHKVPGLRPVFERLRRERSSGAPSLDSGIGEIAPKKSLFGGLFGKA